MSITRRLFLRNTAVVGALGTSIAAPAVAAQPGMTRIEQAKWHMQELERLFLEDGTTSPTILVCGRSQDGKGKSIMLDRIMCTRPDDPFTVVRMFGEPA